MSFNPKAIAFGWIVAVPVIAVCCEMTAFAQGNLAPKPDALLALDSAGASSTQAAVPSLAANPTTTFSSTPLAPPENAPEDHAGPKKGFGAAVGIGSVSGNLTLHNSPGSARPSYRFLGIGYGLDYQWEASDTLSLGLYLRGANGIGVTGDLSPSSSYLSARNPGYDQGESVGLGGEIRYWFGQAFVGGSLGAAMTTLTDSTGVNPDIPLSGTEIGGVAGYEWPSGWQVLFSAASRSLSGILSTTNQAALASKSVPVTATETRMVLLVGYRL